jgi:hypothetical protein
MRGRNHTLAKTSYVKVHERTPNSGLQAFSRKAARARGQRGRISCRLTLAAARAGGAHGRTSATWLGLLKPTDCETLRTLKPRGARMATPMDQGVLRPAGRTIIWINVLTVVSATILIGAEVFGAAFAGGWAIAGLFNLGEYGGYILQIIFSMLGLMVMASFIRAARRVEPFTR